LHNDFEEYFIAQGQILVASDEESIALAVDHIVPQLVLVAVDES